MSLPVQRHVVWIHAPMAAGSCTSRPAGTECGLRRVPQGWSRMMLWSPAYRKERVWSAPVLSLEGDEPRSLCFGVYVLPRLRSMDRADAQRVIATLHSFRFFGLVFIVPGVVGPHLPARFTTFAAYGDLATGVLALLALLTLRIRPLFWLFVLSFNLVGAADLIIDYYHATQVNLPSLAGSWVRHTRFRSSTFRC
jgi:hypothetical protein